MKKCNSCGLEKSINQFNNHPKTRDKKTPKCKSCINKYNKQWRESNPLYNKQWYERKNFHRKSYLSKRKNKQLDDSWKTFNPNIIEFEKALSRRVRRRINEAFKRRGYVINGRTTQIIGCQIKELKNHLESQFKDGMSWENKSDWHIDHVIPLSFAKDEKHLRWLCHYTNLQPLWAHDNLSKANKMPDINGDV